MTSNPLLVNLFNFACFTYPHIWQSKFVLYKFPSNGGNKKYGEGLWASDLPVESDKVFYRIIRIPSILLNPTYGNFRGIYTFLPRYGGMLSSNNPMLMIISRQFGNSRFTD